MLARDRTMSFQVIADEAFIDLLPVDLKDALKRSVKERPTPARTSRPNVPRGDGSS